MSYYGTADVNNSQFMWRMNEQKLCVVYEFRIFLQETKRINQRDSTAEISWHLGGVLINKHNGQSNR